MMCSRAAGSIDPGMRAMSALLLVVAALAVVLAFPASAAKPTPTPAPSPSPSPDIVSPPVPTPRPAHRPLRQNIPDAGLAEPTDPETFSGYAEAVPFSVVPQKGGLTMFPCSQCHGPLPPNPEPRKLSAPHNAALNHGRGRMWCLSCHDTDDRDHLHTIRGAKVDFDDAYLVCGQCHFNRQKDWYLGGHGKRSANWRGDRVIYNCTHCHDPHDPTIKPRKPSPPPPVRAGLQRMPVVDGRDRKVWERYATQQSEVKP